MRDSVPGPPAHCPVDQPPRLLLVLGPPASGKTQLTERLAARYELLVLRKDEIKEVLFDTLGLQGAGALALPDAALVPVAEPSAAAAAAWSRALSDASFALLFALAQRSLSPGRAVLLEGNFRPNEHQSALDRLLRGSGTQVSDEGVRLAQVLCRARTQTLTARLRARATDPSRHRGHRDLDAIARLGHGEPEMRFLALPGPQLCFDSEAPLDYELATLYTALDAWMDPRTRPATESMPRQPSS